MLGSEDVLGVRVPLQYDELLRLGCSFVLLLDALVQSVAVTDNEQLVAF